MQKSLNADTRFWRSGCPNFSFRQWCKRWYDTFPPKRTLRDKELLHQQNAESEWENFPPQPLQPSTKEICCFVDSKVDMMRTRRRRALYVISGVWGENVDVPNPPLHFCHAWPKQGGLESKNLSDQRCCRVLQQLMISAWIFVWWRGQHNILSHAT